MWFFRSLLNKKKDNTLSNTWSVEEINQITFTAHVLKIDYSLKNETRFLLA